jgi:hypothetical protein
VGRRFWRWARFSSASQEFYRSCSCLPNRVDTGFPLASARDTSLTGSGRPNSSIALGVALIVLAFACVAVMSAFGKAAKGVSTGILVFFQNFIGLVLFAPWTLRKGFSELRTSRIATIEGEWAGRVTGLGDQRVEIAMMRTPDGHGQLELSRFLMPPAVADHRNAPVNALGYLRVMFAVDDLDETLEKLRKRGAQLVGEVVQYKDAYRLCYIRGPEGLLIGLAQELS